MNAAQPLPVTIVSGYLGSGKTTLINRLLGMGHGQRLAVLVNDFGEISIDERLIVNQTGDTISLANGCICCSVGGNFFNAIDRIVAGRNRHDHLIIETSGVADPGKALQIALAEPHLRGHGIVALADLANFQQLLADCYLNDTIRRQLSAADLILLTKSDLCNQSKIEAATAIIRELAPDAPQVFADNGDIPFELILSKEEKGTLSDPSGFLNVASSLHHPANHAASYRSWTYSGAAELSIEALECFIRSDDLGIYRLKGFAQLVSGAIVEVQRAGDTWGIRQSEVRTQTRLVAIGLATRFSPANIQTRWLETLA